MNCRELESRLDDLLEGSASSAVQREAEAHLAGCRRCRELEALLREGVPPLSSPDDPELTEAILDRTSGSPCVRAREQLGDLTDGRLAPPDAELVRLHLVHCRPCAALAETLAWLAEELPAMATIEPDAAFAADVLRATSRRPALRRVPVRAAPGPLDRAAARLIGWWAAMLARPRFGLEAAYVGALVLFLLFGTPYSPMRNVGTQVLELTRTNPVQTVQASLIPMPGRVAELGQRAWDATGGRVLEKTRPARQSLAERVGRAAAVTRAFRRNGTEMWKALFAGNLEKSAFHWQQMGSNLKQMWLELITSETPEESAGQEA